MIVVRTIHPSMEVNISAEDALEILKRGNSDYVKCPHIGNISQERRAFTSEFGQHPYAAIVTCSDSRVIPEAIFSAGIGDLFVIRSAGNTVDRFILDSLEYAVGHLGCNLVVVMGHTDCGAISTAMSHTVGHVISIIEDIRKFIAGEEDPYQAELKNIKASVDRIRRDMGRENLVVEGAHYHIDTGVVDFIDI